VSAVGAVEAVAFECERLAVDVAVGVALKGDVEALLGYFHVLFEQLQAAQVSVYVAGKVAHLHLNAAQGLLLVIVEFAKACFGGAYHRAIFAPVEYRDSDSETYAVTERTVEEVVI